MRKDRQERRNSYQRTGGAASHVIRNAAIRAARHFHRLAVFGRVWTMCVRARTDSALCERTNATLENKDKSQQNF
jgi:hypothetical protein